VLLAIEVADSSLAYATGRKSRIYAAYGVREAWVINANTLATRVFRQPARPGYKSARTKAYGRRLEAEHAPELAVSLAQLGLGPVS
jgi:Uma2 family endonuclease